MPSDQQIINCMFAETPYPITNTTMHAQMISCYSVRYVYHVEIFMLLYNHVEAIFQVPYGDVIFVLNILHFNIPNSLH